MINYPFPIIKNLEQVQPLLEGRSDFVLSTRENYSIAQYIYTTAETFPAINKIEDERNAILRELRGIAFDSQGKVISRPFHKFFNLNEREETLYKKLDFSKEYDILEKLDGAMIRSIPIDGKHRLATKLGISQQSIEAEEFISTQQDYSKLLGEAIAADSTLIFEWCSPTLESIVSCKQSQLTLLAVRHNYTGQYWSLTEMQSWKCEVAPNVPTIKSLPMSIEDVLSGAKSANGKEGWVVRFTDGHAVKIKGSWYLRLHRLKNDFQSEKFILDLLLNGTCDDIYAFLNKDQVQQLQAFESNFWQGVNKTTQRLEQQFEEYREQGDIRYFASHIAPSLSGIERYIAYKLWKQVSARQAVTSAIRDNLNSTNRIDSVRFLWGSLEWRS